MASINVERVCRTCILEKDDMREMFSVVKCNGVDLPISDVLSAFIHELRIETDQKQIILPNSICNKCTEHAIIAYNFKELCEKSIAFFNDYLNSSFKSEAKEKENFNNNHIATEDFLKAESFEVKPKVNRKRSASSKAKQKIKSIIEEVSSEAYGDECNTCSDFEADIGSEDVKSEINLIAPIKKDVQKRRPRKLEGIGPLGIKSGPMDTVEKEIGALYCCELCNKWFKNKYTLISHRKRHQFKGQFLCNVCGKGYSSQSCLSRHSIVHTGEKKYECKVCHKKFPSAYNLSLHSRTHSGLKPYLCTVCGKKFRHPTGLTYHMRTHTQEKPYACEVCGKRFSVQCNFDRHRKIHSGERPFACPQCDKAFIKKIDMQRHEQIHTGNKPYSCEHCAKSFLRKKNLIYHMMLHTDERPHICTECNKGFIRSYYLKDHIKKHHSGTIPNHHNSPIMSRHCRPPAINCNSSVIDNHSRSYCHNENTLITNNHSSPVSNHNRRPIPNLNNIIKDHSSPIPSDHSSNSSIPNLSVKLSEVHEIPSEGVPQWPENQVF